MNKKGRSKNPLNLKSPFKWVFMDMITSTVPKPLISDTIFSFYLLIFDTNSKFPKLYNMEKVYTEQARDKLDMFHYRSGKTDEFGWWDLEITSADSGSQFT